MKTSRLKLTGSGLMLAAGLLFTSWSSQALAEDALIPLVMEQSVTGVIDERGGSAARRRHGVRASAGEPDTQSQWARAEGLPPHAGAGGRGALRPTW